MSDAFEERRRKALEDYEARTGKKAGIKLNVGVDQLKTAGKTFGGSKTNNNGSASSASASIAEGKPKGKVVAYKPVEPYVAPEHSSTEEASDATATSAPALAGVVDAASRPAKDLIQPGKPRSSSSSQPNMFNVPVKAGEGKKDWRAAQKEKEEIERQRRESEERARSERAASLSKELYGDSADQKKVDWREQQRLAQDAERKRVLAEEEARKANASAVIDTASSALRDHEARLQAQEEKRREELAAAEAARKEKTTSFLFCSECGTKTESARSHKMPDGATFCNDCYLKTRLIPKGPKCAKCKQPVGSTWIVMKNSKYHAACLKCSKCSKELSGGQIAIQGSNFFCRDCKPGLL